MKVLEFKNLLDKDGIIYSFNGVISQNILISIGDTIENAFEKIPMDETKFSKIFSVFIEQMHNIMSYSIDKVSTENNVYESKGLSLIGFDERKEKYFIGSANFIETKTIKKLEEKLNKVNSLNQNELRDLYKETRRSGKDKHHRGGGLGFLEMAKKSSDKLEFKITPINEETSFFEIIVYI